MTTFLQIHALIAYPPANPNRDDAGRPKSAMFGGVPRLRISSQSLKRAWRTSAIFQSRFADRMGERTAILGEAIERHLLVKGVEPKVALETTRRVAGLFGKLKAEKVEKAEKAEKGEKGEKAEKKEKKDDPRHIEQLAFISPAERAAALAAAERLAADPKATLDVEELLRRADASAIDIAMFGRMFADAPKFNREAAAQVAHAITTHKVITEDDYYTAVDDLKDRARGDDLGAGFIGERGFGAGLFYDYLCIDANLLRENLEGEADLAAEGVAALIEAVCKEGPKGMIASFANHARAVHCLVEAGEAQPRSLSFAFMKPVQGEDIGLESVRRLDRFRTGLAKVYGDQPDGRAFDLTGGEAKGSLAELQDFARKAVRDA